jgi:hypothetical protein
MESAPLQRVSVARCDHSSAGGRQTPFLTRRLRKASLEVHWSRQVVRKAFERLKRQDGVGASPKGQCRPVRPYDSWRVPDAILDRESLEIWREGGTACQLFGVKRKTPVHPSQGLTSLDMTHRPRKGARHPFYQESVEQPK